MEKKDVKEELKKLEKQKEDKNYLEKEDAAIKQQKKTVGVILFHQNLICGH
ncbi:MAG: hypothetical protein PHX40_01685 [Bacilli bacterium]|nr:hypothetical protein [Bacilli bacterium]